MSCHVPKMISQAKYDDNTVSRSHTKSLVIFFIPDKMHNENLPSLILSSMLSIISIDVVSNIYMQYP